MVDAAFDDEGFAVGDDGRAVHVRAGDVASLFEEGGEAAKMISSRQRVDRGGDESTLRRLRQCGLLGWPWLDRAGSRRGGGSWASWLARDD